MSDIEKSLTMLLSNSQDHLYLNTSFNESADAFSNVVRPQQDAVGPGVQQFLFTSPILTTIVAIIATVMSLTTIVGNVLVITAFIIDRNLRKYSNYFILNLSFADLLIGLLIPPYAPFLLYNYNWKLGRVLCTIWLVLDYVVGSASVLCIVVISLDRYLMVSRGLNYITKQKISTAIYIMFTVWIIAFLNYAPAIIFWELLSEDSNKTVNENVCQVGFHDNLVYLTATACVEFFLPFISICSLNLAVYLNIRKRSKGLIRSKTSSKSEKSTKQPLLKNKTSSPTNQKQQQSKEPANTQLSIENNNNNNNQQPSESPDKKENQVLDPNQINIVESPLNVSWSNKNFKAADLTQINKKDKNLNKDKKAARSLFILVFTFVVCWAPYTFLTLIKSVCNNCVKDSVYEITFWLLWFNSTLNPILYPFLHVQFRKAFSKIFIKIFCCFNKKYRNGTYNPNRQFKK